MPYVRDKIIINSGRDAGNNAAIRAELDNLKMLGDEIEEMGFIKETAAYRDTMEKLCSVYNASQWTYLQGLRNLCKDLAAFVDSKMP